MKKSSACNFRRKILKDIKNNGGLWGRGGRGAREGVTAECWATRVEQKPRHRW